MEENSLLPYLTVDAGLTNGKSKSSILCGVLNGMIFFFYSVIFVMKLNEI